MQSVRLTVASLLVLELVVHSLAHPISRNTAKVELFYQDYLIINAVVAKFYGFILLPVSCLNPLLNQTITVYTLTESSNAI